MCCLYCGKDIGAFRLLRDSEFCSIVHRKKYGERLGKALHNIAEPEPAPAGIAGFCVQMPVQQGNTFHILIPWHTDPRLTGIRTGAKWPLTIDSTDAKSDTLPECQPRTSPQSPNAASVEGPPLIERWMAAPSAEPVATFLQASAVTIPAFTLRTARFAAALTPTAVADHPSHALATNGTWMPAPGPEPVAAFVQASAALASAPMHRLPRLVAELASRQAQHPPAACDRGMPAPGPEPVAAFVQASIVSAPITMLRLPRLTAELALDDTSHIPLACDRWMPAPGPEPVAAWVQASVALAPVAMLRLPRLAAELETTPFLDLELDSPPMCERWTSSPGPEPVASFLRSSAVLAPAHALRLPRLAAGLEPASIPNLAVFAQAPAPEPVAAFVQAVAALSPAHAAYTIRLDLASEFAGVMLDARPASVHAWMTVKRQWLPARTHRTSSRPRERAESSGDGRFAADARGGVHSRTGTAPDSRRVVRTAGDVPAVDAGPGGRSGLQLPAGVQRVRGYRAYGVGVTCFRQFRGRSLRAWDHVAAVDT